MKSLHVDTGREMRGGQWQVVYLLERLKDAALLAPGGSALFQTAAKRGIEVFPLTWTSLARLCRSAGVVHAHDARAHTMAVLASRAPVIVSRRVGFPVKSRWKYSRAARFLAVSNFVKHRLIDAGIAPEKIAVVYDGVPIPEQRSSLTGGAFAVRGKCEEIVRNAARLAGIPVHFTSNLWQDLSTASMLIYASELEGLGSAAIAAMAAGVPVIATRAGGLSEVVEDGQTGFLVEPAGIAAAIQCLASNPEEAFAMGTRGSETVCRKFSVDAMVQATQRAYDEVLG